MKWFDPRVPVVVVIVVDVMVVKRGLLYYILHQFPHIHPPHHGAPPDQWFALNAVNWLRQWGVKLGVHWVHTVMNIGRWWSKWWWCNNVGVLAQFGQESGWGELWISYNQTSGGQGFVSRCISQGWKVKVVLATFNIILACLLSQGLFSVDMNLSVYLRMYTVLIRIGFT